MAGTAQRLYFVCMRLGVRTGHAGKKARRDKPAAQHWQAVIGIHGGCIARSPSSPQGSRSARSPAAHPDCAAGVDLRLATRPLLVRTQPLSALPTCSYLLPMPALAEKCAHPPPTSRPRRALRHGALQPAARMGPQGAVTRPL